MMPTEIPTPRPNVEWSPEASSGPKPREDIALLFYALLDDQDLKEVFGAFLVPGAPTREACRPRIRLGLHRDRCAQGSRKSAKTSRRSAP